jgi:UDP-N-acetylmuramyl pentapeptide phosphotransferase/UDP-N-acetylglucosamine-1-phosphate transferase
MNSRTVVTLVSAAATRTAYRALCGRPPGDAATWERKNHAGRTVELYGGLAACAGTVLAVATAPGLPARTRAAAGLAVAVAGGCGAYDDQCGSAGERGWRAHLGALRRGEVTSGAVKLFGIGAAGLAAGALIKERPVDRVLAGVVIAGAAHVVNLVDVKPGRAAKGVIAAGAPGLLRRGPAGALAAAPVAAAAAVLADDVGERTMLGDAGAHALGAAIGVAVAAGNGRGGLVAHAAVLVALAAVGDKVSYSEALWNAPWVRTVDRWGRLA